MAEGTEFRTETCLRSLVSVQKFIHPAVCLQSLKRERTLDLARERGRITLQEYFKGLKHATYFKEKLKCLKGKKKELLSSKTA